MADRPGRWAPLLEVSRTWGLLILAARRRQRLTQAQVGAGCGLSKQRMSDIEHGGPNVSAGAYQRAAAALGIELPDQRTVEDEWEASGRGFLIPGATDDDGVPLPVRAIPMADDGMETDW